MESIEKTVQTHGIQLLLAGYPGTGRPLTVLKEFTQSLQDKLTQLSVHTVPTHAFSHIMQAEFEGGRLPVEWQFAYRYAPRTNDLSIFHIKASLFEVSITVSPSDDKEPTHLRPAKQVLKKLQEEFLISHQKFWAVFKMKTGLSRIRHRVR